MKYRYTEWKIGQEIQDLLFSLQDIKYRDFHSKLMPTIDPDKIIGIRTPVLRKQVKELAKRPDISEFMETLPHTYYEENNLHAFLIEQIKDYEECVKKLERFLPYVDNWATCDSMTPKVFKKHKEELLDRITVWLASNHVYTIRFGIEMLMKFYLDEDFEEKYLDWVAAIRSDEYYVNMMIAWYFATALAKQYVAALPYITENGILVNIDGNSNRVAAIAYGPQHVVMIVGMNKIAKDENAALLRARNIAAPTNAQRFPIDTPCKKNGSCANCLSKDTICCEFLITRYSRHPGRFHIILVNDELGF